MLWTPCVRCCSRLAGCSAVAVGLSESRFPHSHGSLTGGFCKEKSVPISELARELQLGTSSESDPSLRG